MFILVYKVRLLFNYKTFHKKVKIHFKEIPEYFQPGSRISKREDEEAEKKIFLF